MSAWKELTSQEYDEVWDRFVDEFAFKPSVQEADWPSFEPLGPFITWSLSAGATLDDFALAAFRKLLAPGKRMFALDWRHVCWSFDPHAAFERWEVPVIPNGDYYLFIAPDFEWGWLGHPWEQSICIFGEPLLSFVAANQPEAFTEIIRRR